MIKHIMLLVLCLVWLVPCMAEESVIERSLRESREQTQRVRDRNQYVIDQQRETERRQEQWERDYDRNNNNGAEWKYNTDTGKYYWEYKNGLIIEGD